MSDTQRIYTQAVVHFRKPFWSGVYSVVTAAAFAALAFSGDRDLWVFAVIGLPVLYGVADFIWSLRNPYLSIAPWRIVYRPRFWRGSVEISRAVIAAWRFDGKNLIVERTQNQKPVTVKLEPLSKKHRALALTVLRERGYGNLEG